MTVWIYAVDNGAFDQVATVENGAVVEGDEAFVSTAFDGDIPDDEAEVAREFADFPSVSTTDFEMDWEAEDPEADIRSGRGMGNGHSHGAGVTDRDLDAAPEFDRPLLEMYQGVSDPQAATDRTLVSFAASGTPEFVLDRIRDAVDAGAMFSEFEEIPSSKLMELRQDFKDSLGTDDFTLDSITDSLMDFEADLSRDEAERIARTESSAVLNKAREIGYEEEEAADRKFYWTGASLGDPRQTDACAWLIRQTNPFEGGDPVPMNELREMVAEAPEHDDDMADNLARPDAWVVHPNERSTFSLAPGSGI